LSVLDLHILATPGALCSQRQGRCIASAM